MLQFRVIVPLPMPFRPSVDQHVEEAEHSGHQEERFDHDADGHRSRLTVIRSSIRRVVATVVVTESIVTEMMSLLRHTLDLLTEAVVDLVEATVVEAELIQLIDELGGVLVVLVAESGKQLRAEDRDVVRHGCISQSETDG